MMENKYSSDFSIESVNKNISRLINQCWKLIPMKENNENWQKQIETLTIEFAGLNEIFYTQPQILQVLSKLEGLSVIDPEFPLYRKTVFEVISLTQGLRDVLLR